MVFFFLENIHFTFFMVFFLPFRTLSLPGSPGGPALPTTRAHRDHRAAAFKETFAEQSVQNKTAEPQEYGEYARGTLTSRHPSTP